MKVLEIEKPEIPTKVCRYEGHFLEYLMYGECTHCKRKTFTQYE